MGKRNIIFAVGERYHIYNRGAGKGIIFKKSSDYERFLLYLELCQYDISINQITKSDPDIFRGQASESKQLVEIECYCLLPNHYHILVKQLEDEGVSLFMQKLATAYTMYFNTRNDRSGVLFQGKYKAKHIENELYYTYLQAYVSMNYLVHGAKQYKECLEEIFDENEQQEGLICSQALKHRYGSKDNTQENMKGYLHETIKQREQDKEFAKLLME